MESIGEEERINWHKINTINKIRRNNEEVIIYKICQNMDEKTSFDLEKFLIRLIGRADLKTGILTNLTDGGEGVSGISSDRVKKRTLKLLKTLRDNPDIKIKQKEKEMKTKRNNPNIMKDAGKKQSQTKKDNPEIKIKQKEKEMKTKNDNPNIMIEAGKKGARTRKENPEISKHKKESERATKLEKKIAVGRDNSCYKKIDHTALLLMYFNLVAFPELCKIYRDIFTDTYISDVSIGKFLKILNFPTNTISKFHKEKTQIYLKFVEENKEKLQWYIDNYERLEEEYYSKRWEEKYNNFKSYIIT